MGSWNKQERRKEEKKKEENKKKKEKEKKENKNKKINILHILKYLLTISNINGDINFLRFSKKHTEKNPTNIMEKFFHIIINGLI